MDWEKQRSENLQQKQKLLAELQLHNNSVKKRPVDKDADVKQSVKRRKPDSPSAPSRTSARIAISGPRPNYKEDPGEKYNLVEKVNRTSRTTKQEKTQIEQDLRALVPAADSETIRAGWTLWQPSATQPERDHNGTLHFSDYPLFTPNKTPEEVLKEGCFGGSYFRPLKSRKLGILVEDDWRELPDSWIEGLDIGTYLTSPIYNAEINKYKVACGQSIEEWEANGWIAYEHDIRGWFQWYCRFFMGRRCDDDERQISRWRKCVGETGRWRRMLLKKYLQMGVKEVFDDGEEEEDREVSPVMHQTCLHWCFEVRQDHLDAAWNGR